MSSDPRYNPYERQSPHTRRNAVDYSSPVAQPRLHSAPRGANTAPAYSPAAQPRLYSAPRGANTTLAYTRPLPPTTIAPSQTVHQQAPLPSISANAPSNRDSHPYRLLGLFNYRHDNDHPAPSPSECAECRADSYILTCSERFKNPFQVIPDTHYKGLPPEPRVPIFVDFNAIVKGDCSVPLTDILYFRDTMTLPGVKLLRHRPGPLKVSLTIMRDWPARDTVVLSIDDILFGSCRHRDMTRFNVAWWLALHFRAIVEHMPEYALMTQDLRLDLLYSPMGRSGPWWRAMVERHLSCVFRFLV
ncbi:hypothetical protein DFH07DRAFT_777226 [Mycena maculata]|uniref:Uncharacterized protein n=1 Tax=Mycena maculata TaxID=230809 RepID=A0AAD7IK52_9AGAR|nr:hypothetical protein DFH07DRAFT_777226 [Mycena maculata]